jgi:hypothetical protein
MCVLHSFVTMLAKVLHVECLKRWCYVSGKPKALACPFRCYNHVDFSAAEASLLSEASASQSQGQTDQVETQGPVFDVDVDEQTLIC